MIAFIILVICWSRLYEFINSILWILAEIFVPEGRKSHMSKRHIDSKMTRGKSVVLIDVPDPEPLVDAEKLLEMEDKSGVQESVVEKVEYDGRYVSKPRYVSF